MSWEKVNVEEQYKLFENHEFSPHRETYMQKEIDHCVYVQLREEGLRVFVINNDDQLTYVIQHY